MKQIQTSCDASQVLAQVPDVGSGSRKRSPWQGSQRRRSRLSVPKFSAKAVLGVVALLVVGTTVACLLLKNTDESSCASEGSSGWQVEPPAPDAPEAPKFEGATASLPSWHGSSGDIAGGDAGGFQTPSSPAAENPAWNWPSEAQAWSDQSQRRIGREEMRFPDRGDQAPDRPWNVPPQHAPMTAPVETPSTPTQTTAPSLDGRARPSSWEQRQTRTAAGDRRYDFSPARQHQSYVTDLEARQVPPSRADYSHRSTRPRAAASYDPGYGVTAAAPSYSGDYRQTQPAVDPAMPIADRAPATGAYYRSEARPDYRTAQRTRAGTDRRPDWRQAYAADSQRSLRAGDQGGYPNRERTDYRNYDQGSYPNRERTDYRNYDQGNYRPANRYDYGSDYRSGYQADVRSRYQATVPSAYDNPVSGYQTAEPGVARLEGTIEKPTARTVRP